MEPSSRTPTWVPLSVGGAAVGVIFLGLLVSRLSGAFAIALFVFALWVAAIASTLRHRALQNVTLLTAAGMLCLSGGELAAAIVKSAGAHTIADVGVLSDADLGYRARPGQRVEAKEVAGRRVLFDVAYTIDGHGFRALPAAPKASCGVAFLGDSYAFGWGLRDDETLPSAFMRAAGGGAAAENISLNGYGPHHILRAVETGRLDPVLGGKKLNLAIYEAIANHLARAAGRGSWDPGGPLYAIDDGGRLSYVGPFHKRLYQIGHKLLARSSLFQLIDDAWLEPGRPAPQDLPLYVAIVKRLQDELKRRYDAPLVVLFWDTDVDQSPFFRDGALARAALSRLEAEGLTVIAVSSIIPDINARRRDYALSDLDLHPNAAANRLIATYLAQTVAPRYCSEAKAANAAEAPSLVH
jgi:hypothetical protein